MILQTFHMLIISLTQYITEYCNILQFSTTELSTQSKHASVIFKICNVVNHNTHVDDTKHHLRNTISVTIAMSLLAIIAILYVFQYHPTHDTTLKPVSTIQYHTYTYTSTNYMTRAGQYFNISPILQYRNM